MSPISILVIGDKPSKRTCKYIPFRNAACEKRLISWLDKITDKDDNIMIINSNSPFLANVVATCLDNNYPIIVLGNNAEKIISEYSYRWFKLPHPSPANSIVHNTSYIPEKLDLAKQYIDIYRI